jgi:hypothetical protein
MKWMRSWKTVQVLAVILIAVLAVNAGMSAAKKEVTYMKRSVKEFGGHLGRDYFCDNAHKIELGVGVNGSGPKAFGGAREWPVLRIKLAFQEGEDDKMRATAALLEEIIKLLGIVEGTSTPLPEGLKPSEDDDGPFSNFGGFPNRLRSEDEHKYYAAWVAGHWAAGECYVCGKFKWFGGLCEDCNGNCPGCGVSRIRGRLCDECKEKGLGVCPTCHGLLKIGKETCPKCEPVPYLADATPACSKCGRVNKVGYFMRSGEGPLCPRCL